MTDRLNRDELIELLDGLSGEDDAAVLEAAREAHARVAAAGLGWNDLLVPDEPAEEDDAEFEEEGAEEEGDEAAGEDAGTDAESLALIDKLLARKGISEELREELEGYKEDIAEGEFNAADRKYLKAMHQRLSK